MEDLLIQTNYAIDTFYFLVMGVLVMFMACGFSMLEAGMIRAKNTSEILTKNVALYSISCIMYLLFGYYIMYMNNAEGGWLPSFGWLIGVENTPEEIVAGTAGGVATDHSERSDYFFQVVFVATAMSIVSGAVAERMKLWSFLIFAVVMTGSHLPCPGHVDLGRRLAQRSSAIRTSQARASSTCAGRRRHWPGSSCSDPGRASTAPTVMSTPFPGCNMPLATLGMFVLWFGWFGFNGGSELKLSNVEEANAVAEVFVNTNIAACGGLVAALVLARVVVRQGRPDDGVERCACRIGRDNGRTPGRFGIRIDADRGRWGFAGCRLDRSARQDQDRRSCRCDQRPRHLRHLGNPRGDGSPVTRRSSANSRESRGSSCGCSSPRDRLVHPQADHGHPVSEEEEMSGVDIAETGIEAYPEFQQAA